MYFLFTTHKSKIIMIKNPFRKTVTSIFDNLLKNTTTKKTKNKIITSVNGKYAFLFVTVIFFISFSNNYKNIRFFLIFFSFAILFSFITLFLTKRKTTASFIIPSVVRKNEEFNITAKIKNNDSIQNTIIKLIAEPVKLTENEMNIKHNVEISFFDKWVGFIFYGMNIEQNKKSHISDLLIEYSDKGETEHKLHSIANLSGISHYLGYEVITTDFFNLFMKKKVSMQHQVINILPQKYDINITNKSLVQFQNSNQSNKNKQIDQSSHGDDILSYRKYSYGDSLKNISWKQSAKYNELMTKEFTQEKTQNISIYLVTTTNKEKLEYLLDIFTSLSYHFLNNNTLSSVYVNSDKPNSINSEAQLINVEQRIVKNKDSYLKENFDLNSLYFNISKSCKENNIILICEQEFYLEHHKKNNIKNIRYIIYDNNHISPTTNMIPISKDNIINDYINIK